MTLRAKQWQQQFEVLVEECEAYMAAHARSGQHDVATCNGIGHGGNEWSCLRMAQALDLCRQVLAKHKFREPIVVKR